MHDYEAYGLWLRLTSLIETSVWSPSEVFPVK